MNKDEVVGIVRKIIAKNKGHNLKTPQGRTKVIEKLKKAGINITQKQLIDIRDTNFDGLP